MHAAARACQSVRAGEQTCMHAANVPLHNSSICVSGTQGRGNMQTVWYCLQEQEEGKPATLAAKETDHQPMEPAQLGPTQAPAVEAGPAKSNKALQCMERPGPSALCCTRVVCRSHRCFPHVEPCPCEHNSKPHTVSGSMPPDACLPACQDAGERRGPRCGPHRPGMHPPLA